MHNFFATSELMTDFFKATLVNFGTSLYQPAKIMEILEIFVVNRGEDDFYRNKDYYTFGV